MSGNPLPAFSIILAPERFLPLLLSGAIVVGTTIGMVSSTMGDWLGGWVDGTVLLLIGALLFELPVPRASLRAADVRFAALALGTNFLVVPFLGFAVASVFLQGQALAMTGLMIYFLAPCTDWFLGFTRLAGGNTTLGAALIPLNMVTQLTLYPIYLALFTRWQPQVDVAFTVETVIGWFIVPLAVAIAARMLTRIAVPRPVRAHARASVSAMIPWILGVVVVEIFAANITTILDHTLVFARILLSVVVFFGIMWWVAEWLSDRFALAYPERTLLTMTTAARNAPLMLGVTMATIPDQPIVYAAIIIGMLVEFPHLVALTHLLLRSRTGETVLQGGAGSPTPAGPFTPH